MIDVLNADVLIMRKAKDPLAKTMVFHLAEIRKIGKNDSNRDTTIDEAVQYIKKAVQKLKDNTHANPIEIEVLTKYLPVMATKDEILAIINPILASGGGKGDVMKAVKTKFGVNVDMKLVSTLL